MSIWGNFAVGFGVWWNFPIGNGCGLQLHGFSVQTDPYESIFDCFRDSDDFGIVFGGLMLLPERPRTPSGIVIPDFSGK